MENNFDIFEFNGTKLGHNQVDMTNLKHTSPEISI
jgi:hypothetical protein